MKTEGQIEPVMDLNGSPIDRSSLSCHAPIWQDILAQAVTGEQLVDHAMAILRAERALDPERFDDKVYRLHFDVMTTLAKMLAKECKDGHCELCHSSCVKPSLGDVSLSAAELRGASLEQYLKALDMLGLPGEVTLAWVTQLPI